MKNPRRFPIPVGWGEGPTLRVPFVEKLMSDTLVVPITHPPDAFYEVARVPGSWSPHVPEKVPTYDVSWAGGTWRPKRVRAGRIEAVRLSQVHVWGHFLIELDARRPQWCFNHKGMWHGVLYSRGRDSVWTYCEESPYIPYDRDGNVTNNLWTDHRIPDCPVCAKFKTAWVLLRVFPYEDKRVVVKKTDKVVLAQKRRARLPTAFDRILDDDFIEKPSYKPPVERPPIPEIDPLEAFEVDPREQRLATARERNQRLKAAKRTMKGY